MQVWGILMDVRSIQHYIYSGNKLKTNIGASYIVEHLFDTVLSETIVQKFGKENTDIKSWQDGAGCSLSDGKICRIAYIGGGNALVLIDSRENAVELVKDFSAGLLVKYPGLSVGAAVDSIDTESFKDGLDNLYVQLKEKQNSVIPDTSVPYTGLTMLCDMDGGTANFYDKYNEIDPVERRFHSQEAYAKSLAAKDSDRALYKKFSFLNDILATDFEFPTEIDGLGQKESENYIAIIHVDGNNMGKKFRACTELADRIKLSRDISSKTVNSFGKLLEHIAVNLEEYAGFLDIETGNKKNVMPIRPLILGGDDITFICPAKVAVGFTKMLMEFLMAPDDRLLPAAKSIDSCAGIAILPTSYPFFRGYMMAEQLCSSAKKAMRSSKNTNGSWLDFAILHGEQAPELEQIIAQEYHGALGNMHFGPYRVDSANAIGSDSAKDIKHLIDCTLRFKSKCDDTFAHGKIKELRYVLQQDSEYIHEFLQQLKHLNVKIPEIKGWNQYRCSECLWANGYTPYIDAIELMDFMEGVGIDGNN